MLNPLDEFYFDHLTLLVDTPVEEPTSTDKLKLYENTDYTGASLDLTDSSTFFSGFNDKAQSVVITGEHARTCFYPIYLYFYTSLFHCSFR